MPLGERTHLQRSSQRTLDLPPPFKLVTLREVGDAFAHAASVASEAGAGTLVYVGRFDLAEFAVVLEPERNGRPVAAGGEYGFELVGGVS